MEKLVGKKQLLSLGRNRITTCATIHFLPRTDLPLSVCSISAVFRLFIYSSTHQRHLFQHSPITQSPSQTSIFLLLVCATHSLQVTSAECAHRQRNAEENAENPIAETARTQSAQPAHALFITAAIVLVSTQTHTHKHC